MTVQTDTVTRNYLQFCYTCDDARHCDSEETCRSCWAEQGIALEDERNETEILLHAYYE
ncbi:hypothetical protein [Gorillibacterium massiliense]|uniref:hypothetical protein n=1 Tax=Gorillibacterium massiliense TaxID=1280390 RepID=UPI0004B4FCE9|nr:hypothetical protein [Gorillibacterium massiliense]